MSLNESQAALVDWYKLFLVPGAAHCATNDLEPNAPFPQTNLAVMIQWIEQRVKPTILSVTVLLRDNIGDNAQICAWPLRPLWSGNETMNCVYDQDSVDYWSYDFSAAYKMYLYQA
jgi:tannase